MGYEGMSGTIRTIDFVKILHLLVKVAFLRNHSVLMDVGCSTCR